MAIKVPAVAGKVIHIGRAGENLATTVTFDVNEWIDEFSDTGSFSLFVQQGGECYPQAIRYGGRADDIAEHGGLVEWDVIAANTAIVGMGKCELVYTIRDNPSDDGVIVKSVIYDIVVTSSLDAEAGDEMPSAIESWLEEVAGMTEEIANAAEYAERAEEAAEKLENARVVSTTTGSPANASVTLGDQGLEFSFVLPQGPQGVAGPQGATGPQGPQGPQGASGESTRWYSGTAVTGTGANITATVSGSKAGDMYLNKNTQNLYIATAANTWSYQCNIQGAPGNYTKPSGGIPEDDLSDDVKNKLNSGGSGSEDSGTVDQTWYFETLYDAVLDINSEFTSDNDIGRYSSVNNPIGNPSEHGWYEYINGEYIITNDTTVQTGKTYYTTENAKVKVNKYTDGSIKAILLDDVIETENIRPRVSMTIDINGHIITSTATTFLTKPTAEVINGVEQRINIDLVIDGRKSGSEIRKTNTAYLIVCGNQPDQNTSPYQGDKSTLTVLGGTYTVDGSTYSTSVVFLCYTGTVNLNNCNIVCKNNNNAAKIQVQAVMAAYWATVNIDNCNISTLYYGTGGGADTGNASTIDGVGNKGTVNIVNSVIISDSKKNAGYTCRMTDGINNRGVMSIKNSIVTGLDMGVMNNDTLNVDGGIYQSYEHGGFGFGGKKEAYVKNAIIQECDFTGQSINLERNGATFYMSPSDVDEPNYPSVYLDNCTLNGIAYSQYIAFKWTNKDRLHLSNINIPENRYIRIDQYANPPSVYESPSPGDKNIIYVGENCNVDASKLDIRLEDNKFLVSEIEAVTNPSGNPSASFYYELASGETNVYNMSTDTSVVSGKTYYLPAFKDDDALTLIVDEAAVNEHLVFINDKFDSVEKLDRNQGEQNLNKVMQVGYDGTIIPGITFNPAVKTGSLASQSVVIDDEGKLWTIPGGGSGGSIVVDDEIDNTSTNPVENRIIAAALNAKQNTLTAGNNITIQNNIISAMGSSVDPVSKTNEMTQPVGVDGSGKLWTAPSIAEEIILTESTYYYESLYEAIQSINNNFDSYIVPQTNNVQVDIKVDGQILVTLLNNLSEVNQIHPLVDMTIDLNGYTIIVDQINSFLIHNSDENINITINGRKEGSSIIKINAGILFNWGDNVSNITDKSTLTTLSGEYLVTEQKNRQVSVYSLGNSNDKGIISSLTYDPSSVKGFPFIVVTKGSYAGKSAEVGDIFVSDGSNYIHSPENSRYIKGTLGSNGDITQLPSPNSSNINHFYEVIEAGTYEGQTAEIGDFFFCGGNQNYEHWVHVKNLSYTVLENYNLPSPASAGARYEAILEGTYYEGNNSWENVKPGDMFYRANNTWYYFKEKEIKYSLKTGGRSGNVYWGTSGKIIIKNCQINSEMEYPDSGGIQVTGIIGYGNCSFYLDSSNITACYTGRGISSRTEGIGGSVAGIWNYLSKNFYIKNCSVTGNGPYDDLFGIDGLRNSSKIIIENCHIKGLHAGIGNNDSGKLYINDGVYESIGHGGIYAGGSSIAWIKNATIKEGNWVGRSVNTSSFNGAAFYMGGSPQDYSDAIVYLDNCIIEDNSPGNNSIVMRNLIQDAKLYFSNTELQQGAKIRIDQFSEPLNLIYNGEGSNITGSDLYVREEPLSFFPVGTNNGGIINSLPSNDYIVSYTHLPLLIVTAGTYNNQSAQVGDIFVSNGNNWIYSSKDNRILKGTLGDNGDITQLPSPDSSNNNHFYEVVTAGAGPDSNARIGDYYFSNGNSWILVYVNSLLSGTVDISQGIDLPDPSEYVSGDKFRVLSSGRYHTYTNGSSSSTTLAYAGQIFMNKNKTEWIRLYPEQITYKLLIESPNKLNSHIINTSDNYNYLNFSDCINDLSNSFEEILDKNLSVFWCFYNQTSFTEIADAFVKNNFCICNYNSKFYTLESIDVETKTAVFSCVNKNKIFILTCVDSTWSSSIGSINAPIVSCSSNYTLSSTDIGCLIKATGNSEITIPLNYGVLNDELEIMNYGSGTITVTAASGVTLNGETSSTEDNGVFLEEIYITKTIPNQYTSAVLKCVGTNEWVIQGAIS